MKEKRNNKIDNNIYNANANIDNKNKNENIFLIEFN